MPISTSVRRLALAALAAALLASIPLLAQQNAPQKKPTFEAQSTVVLLDIVVRDKKGNPVRDLRPDEVKISEDGVPRDLTAFRLVEGQVSEDRVTGPVPAGLQPDPNRQVSLVTMVFDKVLDNRQLSKQAALDFIANHMESNVWISVFTIDQRLYLRQAFTQDPYLLKQAIFAATSTTSVTAATSVTGCTTGIAATPCVTALVPMRAYSRYDTRSDDAEHQKWLDGGTGHMGDLGG